MPNYRRIYAPGGTAAVPVGDAHPTRLTGPPLRLPDEFTAVEAARHVSRHRVFFFSLNRNAVHAVHHSRSTVLLAYSWQVQIRVGSKGSRHVEE